MKPEDMIAKLLQLQSDAPDSVWDGRCPGEGQTCEAPELCRPDNSCARNGDDEPLVDAGIDFSKLGEYVNEKMPDIVRALSLLKQAVPVAWQPIETAPFTSDEYGHQWLKWCALGRFDKHGFVFWVGGMDADMWLERDAIRTCGTLTHDEFPTHWMPLPAPPGERDLAERRVQAVSASERERIYVASRASVPERSEMWRYWRGRGFNIVSSWIDEAGVGETASFAELWTRITKEIVSCDRLILYAEPSDFPLKGALVEVGIAIALGKPIFVVNNGCKLTDDYKPFGSWAHHPLATFVGVVHDAFTLRSNEDKPTQGHVESPEVRSNDKTTRPT